MKDELWWFFYIYSNEFKLSQIIFKEIKLEKETDSEKPPHDNISAKK